MENLTQSHLSLSERMAAIIDPEVSNLQTFSFERRVTGGHFTVRSPQGSQDSIVALSKRWGFIEAWRYKNRDTAPIGIMEYEYAGPNPISTVKLRKGQDSLIVEFEGTTELRPNIYHKLTQSFESDEEFFRRGAMGTYAVFQQPQKFSEWFHQNFDVFQKMRTEGSGTLVVAVSKNDPIAEYSQYRESISINRTPNNWIIEIEKYDPENKTYHTKNIQL